MFEKTCFGHQQLIAVFALIIQDKTLRNGIHKCFHDEQKSYRSYFQLNTTCNCSSNLPFSIESLYVTNLSVIRSRYVMRLKDESKLQSFKWQAQHHCCMRFFVLKIGLRRRVTRSPDGVFWSLTITWIDKNDLHCVCVGIQSNESPPLPWHVFFFLHLAATLFSWSHNYMSIWGRIFTDKYNFFATQINVVLFTKLGTHIATDNLIGVESLHFGFQLTKIPYQGAHASWQGVHAIHKMT